MFHVIDLEQGNHEDDAVVGGPGSDVDDGSNSSFIYHCCINNDLNMTITNSFTCPLIIFLCFITIIPLVLCDDVGKIMHYSGRHSPQILLSFHQPKNGSRLPHPISRKFMFHGSCTSKDISISQSKYSTSGIPEYIVQIVNTCVSGCAPHDIHLHCGWFASARIINPTLFKRLSYDDCLVNAGKSLASTQIIRFTYSNSFMYPLVLKSARFCS
nr:TPD1 protein homolog 1B [Arachis hypogaea]